MFNGAVPVFCTVEVCVAVAVPTWRAPNVKLDGVKLTAGAGAFPVPLKPTACGLPAALSAIDRLAARAPAAVGVKLTDTVQLAPAPNVAGLSGHVLV
jgi:hypothetical protein